MVQKDAMVPRVTVKEIVDYLAWNDDVMTSGMIPFEDYLGRPVRRGGQLLAGGWRASFSGWAGDLMEKVEQHNFARNYNCHFLCELDLGCRHLEHGNAYNFKPGAMWKALVISHAQYLATTPVADRSPWCAVKSWTIHRNRNDGLHMLWLGLAKDVSGQLLYDFARLMQARQPYLKDLDECLLKCWAFCNVWCKSNGVDCVFPVFTQRTISYASTGDYPCIEKTMKGSKSKWLFVWAVHFAIDVVSQGWDMSEYASIRAMMAWNLLQFVQLSDRAGLFFADEVAEVVHRHGDRFLRSYQYLAGQALASGVCAYKLRPKMHQFAHTVMEVLATKENWAKQELFGAEDAIGKIKRVSLKCHRKTAPLRVAQRRALLYGLRWRRFRKACPRAFQGHVPVPS